MSHRIRTRTTEAIVLKRTNTGELDRVVTLLTPDQGKVVGVAKGVRKLSSSQSAALEPSNYCRVHLITTSGMPIITQSQLVNDFLSVKQSLKCLKQLTAILEMVEKLVPEGEEDANLFEQVKTILETFAAAPNSFRPIQEQLNTFLMQLGYQNFHETEYESITEYVASVADRPMRSHDFLTIKPM